MRLLLSTTFLLVVISLSLPKYVTATELCVVTSEIFVCPCNTSSCHTFDYYLNNSEVFFVDNTTFLFLPGVHVIHSLYNGFGTSGMTFTGGNASLSILTNSGPWFSLTNSNSVSFSGLAVSTHTSLSKSLFSFTNVDNVEMTNMVIESNCTSGISLTEAIGHYRFHNMSITLSADQHRCTTYIILFSNVYGLISVSGTRLYYLGPQLAVLAIDITYSSKFIANTTITIADTEVYQAGVALGFVLSDVDASLPRDSSLLEVLLENVVISGPHYIGLGFEIGSYWGLSNITILNSVIERVNGTALSLGLNSFFPSSAVIKNSQLRWNYGQEGYGVAMSVRGFSSLYRTVAEFNSVTFESNSYSDTVTTMAVSVNITMKDCIFRDNSGTALFLQDASLNFSSHNVFTGNVAYEGAGLSLGEGSKISLATVETRITFANNIANNTGAAIYLRRNPATYIELVLQYTHAWCFVPEKPPSNNVFLFDNNTANNGGDDIFGAYFDFETFGDMSIYYCIDIVASMSTFALKSVTSVASEPSRVCLCGDDGTPRCLEYEISVSIYPRQTVAIQAFRVGQQFGTVRGSVYAQVLNKSSNTSIPSKQRI